MMWPLPWFLLWVTVTLAIEDYRMIDFSLLPFPPPCDTGLTRGTRRLPTALGVNFGFKYMYVSLILSRDFSRLRSSY